MVVHMSNSWLLQFIYNVKICTTMWQRIEWSPTFTCLLNWNHGTKSSMLFHCLIFSQDSHLQEQVRNFPPFFGILGSEESLDTPEKTTFSLATCLNQKMRHKLKVGESTDADATSSWFQSFRRWLNYLIWNTLNIYSQIGSLPKIFWDQPWLVCWETTTGSCGNDTSWHVGHRTDA